MYKHDLCLLIILIFLILQTVYHELIRNFIKCLFVMDLVSLTFALLMW